MNSEDSRLNLLYVVNGYKPAYRVGGPVMSVSAAAEALVDRGHKVTVFTCNSNLDENVDLPVNVPIAVDGVEVWFFERWEPLRKLPRLFSYFSGSAGYLYTPFLAGILEKRISEFDLVHTHVPFNFISQACGRAAINADVPLFYHQRAVFHPEYLKFRRAKKLLYIAAIERPIMRKATTLIALTEAERKCFRALNVKTRCEVIPNGIDPSCYRQEGPSGSFGSFSVDSSQSVILFLSRLHPIKGADLLVRAFVKIAHDFPSAVLVLAGPDEYGLARKLRRVCEKAGVSDRVHIPGMISGLRKIDLLGRADIFCLPSAAEGHSMAILEALASCTPVMITPGCEFPEVASCGAGWVVERKVEAWSKALAGVLSKPEELRRKGRSAIELVRSRYSWELVADKLENVYREGLQRWAKSRKGFRA